MKISFGRKIPITRCYIQDKNTGMNSNAGIFELDCKDKEDINTVKDAEGFWIYKPTILYYMREKYFAQNGISYGSPNKKFYVLEDTNKKVLGVCQFYDREDDVYIDFLESNRDSGYKYAGQSILAAIGLYTLHNNKKRMVIKVATNEALPFYKKVCKFQEQEDKSLEMDKIRIQSFINKMKKKFKSNPDVYC